MGDIFDFDEEDNQSSLVGQQSNDSISHLSTTMSAPPPQFPIPHSKQGGSNRAPSTSSLEKMVRFSLSPDKRESASVCSSSNVSSSLSSSSGLASRRTRMRQLLKLKTKQAARTKSDIDDDECSSLSLPSSSTLQSDGASISVDEAEESVASSSNYNSTSHHKRHQKGRNMRRHYGHDSRVSSRDSSSTGASSLTSRQKQERNDRQPTVSILGAGTDVFAVQDAGSYRMLNDDCSYLCSTIVGSGASASSRSGRKAVYELALLLANKKTRGILFSTQGTAALVSVLDALVVGQGSRVAENSMMSIRHHDLIEVTGGAQEKFGGSRMQSHSHPTEAASIKDTKNAPRTRTGRLKLAGSSEGGSSESLEIVLQQPSDLFPVVAALHFISWDCTTHEPHSSSPSALAASKVRSAVMKHDGRVLRLLCEYIKQDSLVRRVLGSPSPDNGEQSETPTTVLQSPEADHDQLKRQATKRIGSSDDSSSFSAGKHSDPTLLGRRNRRKKRRLQLELRPTVLDPLPENEEADLFAFSSESPAKAISTDTMNLSFSKENNLSAGTNSCFTTGRDDVSVTTVDTTSSTRLDEKVSRLKRQLAATNARPEVYQSHTCTVDLEDTLDDSLPHASVMALDALNRIVTGKEGDGVSCMESEMETENRNGRPSDLNEDDLKKNPLLVTNSLLRESGSLPVLAHSMRETLLTVARLIQSGISPEQAPCRPCLEHLQRRVSTLASLIDSACCLTAENRIELCSDKSGSLIGSLLLLLQTMSDHQSIGIGSSPSPESTAIHDIGLTALRTLTSLTHDNREAGEQLMLSYRIKSVCPVDTNESRMGTSILVDLLIRAAESRSRNARSRRTDDRVSSDHDHVAFDMVVFCLNTLTNVIGTTGIRESLGAYTSSTGHNFIPWLSAWIVNETSSFQGAILNGSFGESNTEQGIEVSRSLEKHEEEPLVLAGNGCILVCCLMRQNAATEEPFDSRSIRDAILGELPENGLVFIQKTLKAFCNFYHYSLGELSVAIVAPVGKLIAELDSMIRDSR